MYGLVDFIKAKVQSKKEKTVLLDLPVRNTLCDEEDRGNGLWRNIMYKNKFMLFTRAVYGHSDWYSLGNNPAL